MANPRRRMVVEEVAEESNSPLTEVKEKVEELQGVTEDLSDDVQKAEQVQEEIAQAVEDVEAPQESVHTHEHPHIMHDTEPMPPHEDNSQEELPETYESELPSHVSNDVPDQFPPLGKPSGTNPLIVIIPGIFLLGALLGGIYFYQKGISLPPGASPEPTPTEVASASAVPSAAPVSSVDLTKYPIKVMNGSGISGEAAKVKSSLEGQGFKVSAVGNASSSDFTKTIIKAKGDVPEAFLTQLSTLLGKTYTLDTNQTLSSSSPDSVQVIIGSTKAK